MKKTEYVVLFDSETVIAIRGRKVGVELVAWQRSQPNMIPITVLLKSKRRLNPRRSLCFLRGILSFCQVLIRLGSKLLIGDYTMFQIWELNTNTLLFESEPHPSETFKAIYWCQESSFVVTWDKLMLTVWNLSGMPFVFTF